MNNVEQENREAERGTGSAATMNVTVITCNRCGKAVTPAVPWPHGEPLIVRAWVECPECVEKDKPSALESQLAEANRERERANMLALDLVAQLQQRLNVAEARAESAESELANTRFVMDKRGDEVELLRGQPAAAEARAEAAEKRLREIRQRNYEAYHIAEEAIEALKADAERPEESEK